MQPNLRRCVSVYAPTPLRHSGHTLRGRVAEFLVAQALGVAGGVRKEWDSFDLLS